MGSTTAEVQFPEAEVMCVSLGVTGFPGAQASDTMAGAEVAAAGLQALPPLFL